MSCVIVLFGSYYTKVTLCLFFFKEVEMKKKLWSNPSLAENEGMC